MRIQLALAWCGLAALAACDPGLTSRPGDVSAADPDAAPDSASEPGQDDAGGPDADHGNPADGNPHACMEADPVGTITAAVTAGTITGASDDTVGSCAITAAGPDRLHLIELPRMSYLRVEVAAAFHAVVVVQRTCGDELACTTTHGFQTPYEIELHSPYGEIEPGEYGILVDSNTNWSDPDATGPYEITIRGWITPGGACDGAAAIGGAIECAYPDSAWAHQCVDGVCVDCYGNDVDDDGEPDGPIDPRCES